MVRVALATAAAVFQRLERHDGSGYPDGLIGAEIPVTARVLQVVDVYDALTTERSYKAALTPQRAIDVLRAEVHKGWREPVAVAELRRLGIG